MLNKVKCLIAGAAAVLAMMVASATVSAQTKGISISVSQTPVSEVLGMIEKSSKYLFLYEKDAIDVTRKVSINVKNASLDEVLGKVFGSGVEWKVSGRQVALHPVKVAPKAKSEPAPKKEIVVSGKVIDTEGLAVISAYVIEKGAETGVLSDINGNYSIKLSSASATLLFSSMGYDDQEVAVNGRSTVDVKMRTSVDMLEEVVVVGYGVQQKESVVGAISQIKTEDILNSGQSNLSQSITGKLSGVLSMQSSGTPGEDFNTLLVRGVSSWNGSAPLVMVDGVERSMNSIDPNEVESISVLKDASATAVYGAKGANGVILVTTKSGIKGKPKMSLSVQQDFNFPSQLPGVVDAYSTASAYNVALKNTQLWSRLFSDNELEQYKNPSSELNAIRYPDVNWYDECMRKCALTTVANLNVSGGTDRTKYFLSLGYKNQGSIFKKLGDSPNFNYNRFNYRANLDFNLTKITTLSFRVGGAIGIRATPSQSPINGIYLASNISFPAYYPSWVLEEIPDTDYPNASGDRLVNYSSSRLTSYYGNPYTNLANQAYSAMTSSQLFTDVLLDQQLPFITKGLSLKGKFSFSTTMSRVSKTVNVSDSSYYLDFTLYDEGKVNPWIPATSTTAVQEYAPISESQGSMSAYSYILYWEASLNYDRTFGNHKVTALALFNQKETRSSAEFPYRNQGIVGRATYGYKGKYLLELNVGYTGSEQFAPANRYGLFPSVALGYTISQEKFWKKAMPWWTKMKIRYSDGLVGNDQAANRFLYYSSFIRSGNIIYEQSAANQSAQWETAHKRDLGLEMAWFKNRLSLNVDLFDEHRYNMLVNPVVTRMVGVDYKEVNKGEMKKHGFEVEAGWKDKFANGLSYHINGMFSFNENRIVNYEDAPYLPDYQKVAGKPYQGMASANSTVDGGYYTSIDDIHNYCTYTDNWLYIPVGSLKYLDYKVDGTINTDDLHSVKGSVYPSMLCSLGGGLNYKGWNFSFLFYGNFGKYLKFDSYAEFMRDEIRLRQSQTDYWTPSNTNATHATLVYNGSAGSPMYSYGGIGTAGGGFGAYLDGGSWANVNYVSLRDVQLGYTFDTKSIKDKAGIGSLNVYLTGNNLFLISNFKEGNPERTTIGFSGYYPLMKTVQLGLKVGF